MIDLLSREDQERLHLRYRNSDLFRHWSPLLCQLEWEMEELDMTTIWWLSEQLIERLRQVEENRDEMITFLFKQLLKDCREVRRDGGAAVVRTPVQTELTAVTVMCVVLTRLMNAAEEGHEEEEFANRPMCIAIANLLRSHPHFTMLMERFFKKRMDNEGRKIVITPSDPMNMQTVLEEMDQNARMEVEAMNRTLLERTECLRSLFDMNWEQWVQLCQKVCLDQEMMGLLKKISPRNNDWGINQKLVCNMVGVFCKVMDMHVSLNSVNDALSDKNVSSYLRNHADFGGNDSALNKSQHSRLKKMMGVD